ncbi:MAG TPA: 3-phenylpropionate/cinnamic acid dioxygenase subunit beta [Chloroflexota bacterium]|nr:3-phenylpropionate/cinnamic acid dioxygenase subunit beta [Chloroflexota bacterium]
MTGAPPTALQIERLLLKDEVEEFLYAEAELLDARRYDDWLDLLTEDVRYVMPIRRNVSYGSWNRESTQAGRDICWFDEDKTTLRKRVQQMNTGVHWAEEPISRVCHMVSNVRLIEVRQDEVVVSCRFMVYRNRQDDETDFFVGHRRDVLHRIGRDWRIASREILLDQSVLLAKNLTLFF